MMADKIIEVVFFFNGSGISNIKYVIHKPLGCQGLADHVSSPSFVANVLEGFQQLSTVAHHAKCVVFSNRSEIISSVSSHLFFCVGTWAFKL